MKDDMVRAEPVKVHLESDAVPWGPLRSLVEARRNILRIIPDRALHEPIISGRTGRRWHMVMDPDAIRHMLLDALDTYPKSDVTKSLLRPVIGDSLFIAEGSHWRWQRRTAAPAFSHRNVTSLAPIMTAAADRASDRIGGRYPAAVDMLSEMVDTTFDVIADVTFSDGDSIDRQAIHRAIEDYVSDAGKVSLLDVLGIPDWVPRPHRMIAGKAMREAKALADKAIEARAARGSSLTPDLLDLLLAGEDPKTGRAMTTAELRDNLLTFIVAGHETTALTLAWSLYLVAFDPDIQERARSEAQTVLDGRPATGADVSKLPFVRAIVDEALRLYPPAGVISRTARAADTLCGTEIRSGDTCIIPTYAIQRSRRLWDNPDSFVPDRWTAGLPNRYTYLPFGYGPRICIGMSFAIQEAVIVLATLLSLYRFARVPGRDPDPVMILTLRPEGGVWLTAEPLS